MVVERKGNGPKSAVMSPSVTVCSGIINNQAVVIGSQDLAKVLGYLPRVGRFQVLPDGKERPSVERFT